MNRTKRTEGERAHLSACAKVRNRDPQWLFRSGFLLPQERSRIVAAARAGISYPEIAAAYSISVSQVSRIATNAGYRRQRRRRYEKNPLHEQSES